MRGSSKSSSSIKLKIIPKVKKEREKLHKQKSNSSLSGKRSKLQSITYAVMPQYTNRISCLCLEEETKRSLGPDPDIC